MNKDHWHFIDFIRFIKSHRLWFASGVVFSASLCGAISLLLIGLHILVASHII